MNKNIWEGEWHVLKGKIKEKWGDMTDNDLTKINGKREELLGYLQKKYGYQQERAEKEVSDWEKTCHNSKHGGSCC